MSLAMFAAPFNDNSNITLPNNSDGSDILNQKRHKRTIRKYPKIENFDTNKVNSVLQKIHNSSNDDEDDDKDSFNVKENFNPPPAPESAGVQRTPETFGGMNFDKFVGRSPSPNYEGGNNLDLNDYGNYGDSKSNDEYYRRVIPGYEGQKNNINRMHYNAGNNSNPTQNYYSQDVLMQKLNYVISLLEDKQDEKTDNVTEEVILYSFLGIFVIFIADTFVRAGKYVR